MWRSDGETAGTAALKDIRPGAAGSVPSKLTPAGSKLYFWADQGTGYDLWKTDGTDAGTALVKSVLSLKSPPLHTIAMGNNVIFNQGGENWWSDGTAAGTIPLNVQSNGGLPEKRYFAILGQEVFFSAREGAGFSGLWKSNGTQGGTVEIAPRMDPQYPITVGDAVLFWSVGELWRSNGTSSGTTPIVALPEPATVRARAGTGAHPSWLVSGGKLYFGSDELYVTDGTAAGSKLVKDIFPGENRVRNINDSKPYDLVMLGDTIYFAAADEEHGRELWKTNGTEAGTVMVADIWPGACSSRVSELAVMDGMLYFNANDGVHGAELWQSDGTAQGTAMIADLYIGTASSYPVDLTAHDGKLYFIASSYSAGREFWVFDTTVQEEGVPTLSIAASGAGTQLTWPVSFGSSESGIQQPNERRLVDPSRCSSGGYC